MMIFWMLIVRIKSDINYNPSSINKINCYENRYKIERRYLF